MKFCVQDECDFPENVNCEVSIGDISRMKVNLKGQSHEKVCEIVI
jgi:hypothetical protein